MSKTFKDPSTVPESFDTFWHFDGQEAIVPDGATSFVYCITNTISGKKYFGKKKAFFKKTRQRTVTLKNGNRKKKKIIEYVPSDWMEYYGSNDNLKKDIIEFGCGKFFREILEWCNTDTAATYIEGWYHFHFNVLLYPELFYNQWIMIRTASTHIKDLIGSTNN